MDLKMMITRSASKFVDNSCPFLLSHCQSLLSSIFEVNIWSKIQRQCRTWLSFLSFFYCNCITGLFGLFDFFWNILYVASFENANATLSLIAFVWQKLKDFLSHRAWKKGYRFSRPWPSLVGSHPGWGWEKLFLQCGTVSLMIGGFENLQANL